MFKTDINNPILPKEFKEYQQTINDILSKLKNQSNVCYITIDSKTVDNCTHRRPGIHVDFNWYEDIKAHGHRRCFDDNGGVLLVSNYPACKVWKGKYSGKIGEGGDCSNIDVSHLDNEIMPANMVYFLNSIGIHESLKINEKVNRQLIRINFHPEYEFSYV